MRRCIGSNKVAKTSRLKLKVFASSLSGSSPILALHQLPRATYSDVLQSLLRTLNEGTQKLRHPRATTLAIEVLKDQKRTCIISRSLRLRLIFLDLPRLLHALPCLAIIAVPSVFAFLPLPSLPCTLRCFDHDLPSPSLPRLPCLVCCDFVLHLFRLCL